jgi:NAD(P)-dependent dehydrogenase (short-subunit alcohol dehydrogenase family)
MDQLKGKVAIVTGSSGGIGKGIAEVFASEGAKVALAARSKDKLEQLAASIKAAGGTALAVPTDVTKEADVIALVKRTVDAFGRLDVLVNNAGMAWRTPTEDSKLDDWMECINLNLTGPFLCSREAIKVMKKQGGGRIINIGSISAIVPRRHSIAYAATKAGIEGMTRSLTLDGRDYNVVASVIHPGSTASSFNAARGGPGAGKTPADYIMDPHDLGKVALLMASLPPEVNLFEATLLPNHMVSFIDRG